MLKVEKIKQDKERFLPLLRLHDPNDDHMKSYLNESDLYILFSNQIPICEACVKKEGSICHIISIATEPNHRDQGYAARLVDYVKDDYAREADILRIELRRGQEAPFYALGFTLVKEEAGILYLQKNLKESEY